VLLLDGSVSPYLPTKEILDAIEAPSAIDFSLADLACMLKSRLALLHGVSSDRIALFPNDTHRLGSLLNSIPGASIAQYPPCEDGRDSLGREHDVIEIERSDRFRIELPQIKATPPGAIALVMTPNDPTGTVIGSSASAQLARRAAVLVLDERSAEMQRRSMIPLVEEFDSIVLLRSFADWAGLGEDAPGYAITTRPMAAVMDRPEAMTVHGLNAALAAVGNAPKLDTIAQRIRLERLRLYRMLRKLNFVSPYPSDAGYVLAVVTRGDRDVIADALLARGISVFVPSQCALQRTLRFAAISPAATRALQSAMIDISRAILD
jgi:histidinol-phosphate aminotransferase